MPGLVPGIHAAPPRLIVKIFGGGAAWMAGTSPAMTTMATRQFYSMSGLKCIATPLMQ
jgi:hypothetical protein